MPWRHAAPGSPFSRLDLGWLTCAGQLTSFATSVGWTLEASRPDLESANEADDACWLEEHKHDDQHAIEDGAEITAGEGGRAGVLGDDRERVERQRQAKD